MNQIAQLATQLHLPQGQVAAAVRLLDDDNTVPFIARYRKEATGGLDDEQLQRLALALKKVRAVDERREAIRRSIEEQGRLIPALGQALDEATTLADLEDLYAPYKPRRKTRGSVARAAGLAPLARLIVEQPVTDRSAADLAFEYIRPETPTSAHVWQGARDIVAEMIGDHARVRQTLRRRTLQNGTLICTRNEETADPKSVYQLYYNFSQPVAQLKPHQVLAVNRGEKEKVLRVRVEPTAHDVLVAVRLFARPDLRSPLHDQLQQALDDALKRLVLSAIERDVRRELTETAEAHAIAVFADNLRDLLLQAPLPGHTILAIDPGYAAGCKYAVVDPTGKVLEAGTLYPHPPQARRDEALKRLLVTAQRHHVTLVAIGNGTASRETEQLTAELTQVLPALHYLIVNEAGASVYSASETARAELPDLDVTLRGAVSIGRRVQDPLAELVKIDPKAIGVGLYQHDVDQKALAETLEGVVELVVNRIGVELNTASAALLTYVAGIGPHLARQIVAFREAHGPFANRSRLLKVDGLGKKTFEQAAGFLRIRGGDNPLDATAIHPESYPAARAVLQRAGISLESGEAEKREALGRVGELAALAAELQIGLPTLTDMLEQLAQPDRDPRADAPPPLLRQDVLSLDDLQPGQVLHGTVRNIVDFGAFVDIGVKRDGLLHRSHFPAGQTLSVGQVLAVRVKNVDRQRGRISLEWGA